MPSKAKNAAIAARSAALPKIPKELLDQFVTGPMSGEVINAASIAGRSYTCGRHVYHVRVEFLCRTAGVAKIAIPLHAEIQR